MILKEIQPDGVRSEFQPDLVALKASLGAAAAVPQPGAAPGNKDALSLQGHHGHHDDHDHGMVMITHPG